MAHLYLFALDMTAQSQSWHEGNVFIEGQLETLLTNLTFLMVLCSKFYIKVFNVYVLIISDSFINKVVLWIQVFPDNLLEVFFPIFTNQYFFILLM